jgi:hypothetical protein
MSNITPIYMSVSDAARRYGIGRDLMYEIIGMNEAPNTLKLRGKRLLPIKDFDAFIVEMFQDEKKG